MMAFPLQRPRKGLIPDRRRLVGAIYLDTNWWK
jgi:hypothetical protein